MVALHHGRDPPPRLLLVEATTMNSPQTANHADGRRELRATQAHPVIEWEVLTGAAAPPGQRILKAGTMYAIHLFPMSIEQAQHLGRALAAPGVIAAS
jgi:hypothetical protein